MAFSPRSTRFVFHLVRILSTTGILGETNHIRVHRDVDCFGCHMAQRFDIHRQFSRLGVNRNAAASTSIRDLHLSPWLSYTDSLCKSAQNLTRAITYLDLRRMTPILELRMYRNGPESTTAVQEISLQVQRGEFFALLGPSGCGKTTTLGWSRGMTNDDR